jgi:chromosome segregation ATPase
MIIDKVEIGAIRGITKTVELGKRTLLTGPNGSGKSAVPVTIDFALLGLIPGYKKNETFANASGDVMKGVVYGNGHIIERTLLQGKTLQERIRIDGGTPADPKAAVPMLELILGKEPPVLNMPGFFQLTSTEQRRLVLKLVAAVETQEKLESDEKAARAKKNDLTRTRQVAEKAVENLTKRLATMEKPAGNIDHIKAEIAALTAQIRETEKKVADGEAADRLRAQYTEDAKALETASKALQDAEAASKKPTATLKKVQKAIDALEAPVAPEGGEMMSEQAQSVIREAHGEIKAIIGLCEYDDDKADLCEPLEGIAATLTSVLPDAEAISLYEEASAEYRHEKAALEAEMRLLNETLAKLREAYKDAKRAKEAAEQAEKRLADLGAGLDQKDKAALEGMKSRRAELEAKSEPLAEIAMVQREIESARLEAEKALADEEAAKPAIEAALQAQQAVVEQAAAQLAKRSKELLPKGNLKLEDDGKDITISWAKSKDLRVQRVSLSGGEKAIFDCALGHALCPTALVVIEGAEIDDNNILTVMEHIPDGEFQVVMLTCHTPATIPDGWTQLDMAK